MTENLTNNNIQLFNNEKFGEIRIVENNGKVLFCGVDIAKALGYANTTDALNRHCQEDGVAFHEVIDSRGRTQNAKFISEGNLYRLISHSKLPSAIEFEKWVFDEVLPIIRKTGGYVSDDEQFLNTYLPNADEQTKLLFKSNLMVIRNLNEKIEADKPKVLFADSVNNTEDNISMADMAKLLKQNGIDIGRQRLFSWLRDNNYLMKRRGINYNTPTQKGMNLNLFYLQESVVHRKNGSSFIQKITRITPKGQTYLVNKFLQS